MSYNQKGFTKNLLRVVSEVQDACCFENDGNSPLVVSPDQGNSFEIRGNGLYVPEATEPLFSSSVAFGIDNLDIIAWNAAFDERVVSAEFTGTTTKVLTLTLGDGSIIEADFEDQGDSDFAASPAFGITNGNITNWNQAFNGSVVSAEFTGTTTKTLVLTLEDTSTIEAQFTDLGNITNLYNTDGVLTGPRTIDMAGFSLTFNNNGLFRIVEGDVTTGSVYDFNNGVDFLNYDATYSANIKQNSITGIQLSVVDVVTTNLLASLEVTPLGVMLKEIKEYADNAAAVADGLPVDYLYRTAGNLKIVI
jgi:hypothetical protein